jgi:hypothetical protein
MGNQMNDNMSDNEVEEHQSAMEMAETMAAGSIEFRNVTFGYKPEKPILHQMSFHVKAGQTLGLVIIKIVAKLICTEKLNYLVFLNAENFHLIRVIGDLNTNYSHFRDDIAFQDEMPFPILNIFTKKYE